MRDIVVTVAGGRDFYEQKFVFDGMSRVHDEFNIVKIGHGASGWDIDKPQDHRLGTLRGVDRFVHVWAHAHQIEVVPSPAAWSRQKGGAGRIRARHMLDTLCPHLHISFPGNFGTRMTEDEARARKIVVRRIWKLREESIL